MRDNLLNARFTNRDAPSPGSLPNYAAHAPMFTRYSEKRISTSTCSGASPASSTTTSSTIYPTASVRAAPPVYPNRIQFRILLGTMFSPAGIVLSHTFASILTYREAEKYSCLPFPDESLISFSRVRAEELYRL